MMLRYSLDQDAAASLIEKAVDKVLRDGIRTADIAIPGQQPIGTDKMGDAIVKAL
jgi:3-isopropylmalate dehydrogenase